jgi:glycosyltransferase involved in cell wall biosynthesis
MTDITVVIPVKNEERSIKRCLAAATKIGPIVVVDSGSTDSTPEIATSAGATLLNFDWNGQFPKKRNWVLRNYKFKTDWVLFLDADEFVSDEFVTEVHNAITNTDHVGFWLNFSNYFMGKKLVGGDPFRKLALFRFGAGEYEKIEENNWSHLDMEVHEHPVLVGSVGEIKTPIEHNDFRGLKHYIAKHNEYSSWEAARYLRLEGGKEANLKIRNQEEWNNLTERQKKKYRNLAKWWFAPAYFMVSFLLKRGYRDGVIGFNFSALKAFYFYQIRLKILESRQDQA